MWSSFDLFKKMIESMSSDFPILVLEIVAESLYEGREVQDLVLVWHIMDAVDRSSIALPLLAELMVEVSKRTQLIVTTHSDSLVSALTQHTESVLVCENQGGTTLHRLESAKLRYWLDQYRLGEIWRIGEIGGNP